MKRVILPILTILHCFCIAMYMYDPNLVHYNSYGWGVFFHCTESIFLTTIACAWVIIDKKGRFDNWFLITWGAFNLSLTLAYIIEYLNIIHHTYGFIIATISMAILLFIVIISGFRHGYFKN